MLVTSRTVDNFFFLFIKLLSQFLHCVFLQIDDQRHHPEMKIDDEKGQQNI